MDHMPNQGEDRKTAYQTTVQLMVYEGNVLWTRLNAMVVLNALLIASATFLIQGNIRFAAFLPPLLGVVLSGTLAAIMYRGQDFHEYWEATAVSLEAPLADENLKILSRAAQLRDGQVHSIETGQNSVEVKLHLPRFRARKAIVLITMLIIAADLLLAELIFLSLPPA
jgi:hypothetical protein